MVSEDVKNFQALVTNLKNEARQLKAVAHFNLFDTLGVVDAQADRLALRSFHRVMATTRCPPVLQRMPKRFSFLLNFVF